MGEFSPQDRPSIQVLRDGDDQGVSELQVIAIFKAGRGEDVVQGDKCQAPQGVWVDEVPRHLPRWRVPQPFG